MKTGNIILLFFLVVLLGIGVGYYLLPKSVNTKTAVSVAQNSNLSYTLDSLKYVKASTALLIARDSINALQLKYRQLLGKVVFSDTVKSKPVAQVIIEEKEVVIWKYDTIRLVDTVEIMPKYALKLPTVLGVANQYVSVEVGITKDSATLSALNLYGTVEIEQSEKTLPNNMIQRSVMFKRSNPYVTNFNDGYVEEPRLTSKGLFLKQAKVAAWTIPITFATSYFAFRQGWIK